MIRAPMGDTKYWQKWTTFGEQTIQNNLESIQLPSGNPIYEAQFVWDLSVEYLRLAITRYSKGDPIRDLSGRFSGLLDAWKLSNRLSEEICREHNLKTCRDWTFDLSNLNHYNWCFWLVGLALALEIPDDQWQRLLALIGGEGEDVLLDRVIASCQPERKIGTKLLHKKPYARLLKAIDAPKAEQAVLLRDFVEHWYPELARQGKEELWWYIYGDPVKHPLEKGSYFGRWCIEAVAAVKAFGLDDSLCLGHEHYPGDLLSPDGPTTHPARQEPKKGLLARLFGKA
ncbi:MAG: PoNe immunity protein domain-containing protein [Actinomycetota bacterium]